MSVITARKNVKTSLGPGTVVESDTPYDSTGLGGTVVLLEKLHQDGVKKLVIRTTGDYRGDYRSASGGVQRGWQCALNKDQVLCLARELIAKAGEMT